MKKNLENQQQENRQNFLSRLTNLPEETVSLIDFAYDLSKEAHRPQLREGGARYFEHIREVALILIDELQIANSDMIITALLHDSVEDSAMFANATTSYSAWKQTAFFRLSRVYNEAVATMVITLTKPKADGEEFATKAEAHSFYEANLAKASAEAILVKMCDRLHNLRTLSSCNQAKIARKIEETVNIYFPIFKSITNQYPLETAYMIEEMEKEISKLQ